MVLFDAKIVSTYGKDLALVELGEETVILENSNVIVTKTYQIVSSE